jgi:hypothetical protein
MGRQGKRRDDAAAARRAEMPLSTPSRGSATSGSG